jgi:type II secretory ATPase GspE/PulE/Tfp pilus assembly ATPase PilB-like protein
VPLADEGRYLDMRLQYDSAHLFGENFVMADVDSLGFSQEQLKVVQNLRQLPGGMRVFSGPVNQGKTTTLRLCLNRRMSETNMQLNCLLIEDPPEGGVIGSRQIGVSASVKDEQRERTFVEIMRCALRLDPDIVMLGEIRDMQTAKFALRLALTGRQVYTTTHVYEALAIPKRLRDIGIEPYLVYDYQLLRGLICQRLLRGVCMHCRIPLAQAPAELGPMYKELARRVRAGLALMDAERSKSGMGKPALERLSEPDLRDVYVANPEGCPHCYKGRAGRTVCAEVIETDHKIMELLQDNRVEDARAYWLSPAGMNGITMLWHGLEKTRRGEVSPLDAEFELGPCARDRDVMEVEQRLGMMP